MALGILANEPDRSLGKLDVGEAVGFVERPDLGKIGDFLLEAGAGQALSLGAPGAQLAIQGFLLGALLC
jgi:hypothetical protein